jgi:hypothetical protein
MNNNSGVSITSGYNKLNGLEISTSAALVREAESDMATMINQMDAVYQPLLPG